MNDKIKYLPTVTKLDIDPDRVLKYAIGKLKSAVVIGYDEEGQEYFASSIADGGEVLWLLERLKLNLLNIGEEDE